MSFCNITHHFNANLSRDILTMLTVVLFVIWCLVLVLWSWMKPRRLSPPMYPGALPLIGHAHMMIGDSQHMWNIEKRLNDFSFKKEEVIEFRIGMHSVYVITDPDDSLIIANTCFEKAYVYKFMKEMYNRGLVTAGVSKWKSHRRLLNPAFNQKVLHAFVEEYSNQAKSLVSQLASEVGKGPFDVQPYLIKNVLSTVCRTSLGLNIDEQNVTVNNYAHATEALFSLCFVRLRNIWLHLPCIFNKTSYKKKRDQFMKVIIDITNAVIDNRKSELKGKKSLGIISDTTSGKFKLLIDHMLDLADEQDAFTDGEIREHLDTMVAAAYDTTATTMTFTLLLIGSHQDVQERIYKELQEVLDNQDRDLNRYDLPKLEYMEAVIKESLRVLPPVPRVARSSSSDVKLKHYTLPSGCTCLISIYALNRHPMWGADAEQFRPERWLNPATLPQNPSLFASFSLGRRNCIGRVYAMMAVKTTLAYIIRRYRITSDISKLQTQCDLFLKPVAGHHIGLELRT